MKRRRSPSPATRTTLFALFENGDGLHGYDITRTTGVGPGTLYPMLMRLEQQDLMTAEWSPSPEPGRPQRHVYRLTSKGKAFVQQLQSEAAKSNAKVQPLGVPS